MKNLTIEDIKKTIEDINKALEKTKLNPPINLGNVNGFPTTKIWCDSLNEYIVIVDYPNTL